MPDHKIGTREQWQAARGELAKLEAEQAERNEEIKRKRRELPWVPVQKEYAFDTEEGKKTLAELFDGRSQLLAYNIMYGPDYTVGACPGCTNLADGFDATTLLHLNKRDVTMICFSRAPIDRLTAYKQRMGWVFPYISTYDTDFPWDFGLALTEEQAEQIRCRRLTRLSRRTSTSSSTARRRNSRTSRSTTERTSTRRNSVRDRSRPPALLLRSQGRECQRRRPCIGWRGADGG